MGQPASGHPKQTAMTLAMTQVASSLWVACPKKDTPARKGHTPPLSRKGHVARFPGRQANSHSDCESVNHLSGSHAESTVYTTSNRIRSTLPETAYGLHHQQPHTGILIHPSHINSDSFQSRWPNPSTHKESPFTLSLRKDAPNAQREP